jgi:hypothetical protein
MFTPAGGNGIVNTQTLDKEGLDPILKFSSAVLLETSRLVNWLS